MDAGQWESMLEIRRFPFNFVAKLNMQIAEVQYYFSENRVILASVFWSKHA